jgi:glycosyltransferase involved in cell wall biosynthesis
MAANEALIPTLAGLDVQLVPGPAVATPAALVLEGMAAHGASAGVIIDGRAALVSPEVLREQAALHEERGAELTLSPLASKGLAGIVVSSTALPRLDALHTKMLSRNFMLTLFEVAEFCDASFNVAYHELSPSLHCPPASLWPERPSDLAALSALALSSHGAYEPIFTALCQNAWRATSTPPRLRRAKPKILIAHYTARRDPGSTRAFEILLERWDLDRHDATVVLPSDGELLTHLAKRMPVRVLPLTWVGNAGARLSWPDEIAACRSLLEEEQPDAVFVSGSIPPLALSCRALGIPTLSHIHLPLLSSPPHQSGPLCRQVHLPEYDLVVATSKWYGRRLRATFRPPPGRMVTVPYGTPLERFQPSAAHDAEARRRFDLPPGARVVSVVGMLTAIKRPELAIETLVLLARQVPDVVLLLAGADHVSSGYEARLRQQARERGVADRVRFLGFIEDASHVYAASDVLLHCGIAETFGMVMVEAMAMRRPVVAIDKNGPSEIVVTGETGTLVPPPGDPEALAEALARILIDPALAARMGELGQRRAREQFGADIYATRLQTLVDRLARGEPIDLDYGSESAGAPV